MGPDADRMNNSKFIIISILLIFLLPFTYGGCFVVFSSGDTIRRPEDDGTSSDGFVGIISQATIGSENAVQLTAGALTGGLTGYDSKPFLSDQRVVQNRPDAFRILQWPLILRDSLRKIDISPVLTFFSRSGLITENGRFEGSCGGHFSHTLRLNRETEKFDGSLAFDEYCDGGISISGDTDVEGSFQAGTGNFVTAAFFFEHLSDGAHRLDGEISMDFSASPTLVTFSACSTDVHGGQVYWIKDYSLNLFEFAGHVEIEIFGAFYHPDYGFVTLTTSDPFIIHDDDEWPASGQMIIYGDHNTSAQLMAIDHLRYGIEADSAGDGIFDWDSGILSWHDASSG
jgi:hypothetical protein